MDNSDRQPDEAQRLRSLLKEAGYTSSRIDRHRRALLFMGRTREWTIVARMHDGWLNIYTHVCQLPTEPGVRARLLETVMTLNQRLLLTKFVSSATLVLELDYRTEHVDVEVLKNLVGLLYAAAEEYYPRIFCIASGDDVLEALGDVKLVDVA